MTFSGWASPFRTCVFIFKHTAGNHCISARNLGPGSSLLHNWVLQANVNKIGIKKPTAWNCGHLRQNTSIIHRTFLAACAKTGVPTQTLRPFKNTKIPTPYHWGATTGARKFSPLIKVNTACISKPCTILIWWPHLWVSLLYQRWRPAIFGERIRIFPCWRQSKLACKMALL